MGGRNTESCAFPYWRIFVTFVGVSKKYIVTPKMVTKIFEERGEGGESRELEQGEFGKGKNEGLMKVGLEKMKEG